MDGAESVLEQLNIALNCLALQLRILEVAISNLNPDTGYSEWFSCLPSARRREC